MSVWCEERGRRCGQAVGWVRVQLARCGFLYGRRGEGDGMERRQSGRTLFAFVVEREEII